MVIHYTWVEPNRRRDKDNIAFAKKFVQDSLVRMGVLENDGWKQIEYFTDSFAVDPENPRVEVIIEDYEGGKPSALLESFTTRQLVEELFRRIGTEKEVIEDDNDF